MHRISRVVVPHQEEKEDLLLVTYCMQLLTHYLSTRENSVSIIITMFLFLVVYFKQVRDKNVKLYYCVSREDSGIYYATMLPLLCGSRTGVPKG